MTSIFTVTQESVPEEKNKNNFSYWWQYIKDLCVTGNELYIPDSIVFDVPKNIQMACYGFDSGMQFNEYHRLLENFFFESGIYSAVNNRTVFNKNAVFSDKFNFVNCISNQDNIVGHFKNINYDALCVGAGGTEEFVIREWLPYDLADTPTIYQGLPVRSEFRCFYDFDNHRVLDIVNYWKKDYILSNLYSKTDIIIFTSVADDIEKTFNERKDKVYQLVTENMKNVELTGKWSVDVMYNSYLEKYYLIDMALAENSTYNEVLKK